MQNIFRDYFNRPRGEFLTRGAALASQQSVVQSGDYGQALGTPVGSTRGSLSSHLVRIIIFFFNICQGCAILSLAPNHIIVHLEFRKNINNTNDSDQAIY